MAGGKSSPSSLKVQNNLETFKEGKDTPVKFSLRGILGLNQSVEISRPKPKDNKNWSQEFLGNIKTVGQEQKVLFDERQQELEKTIKDLQVELKNLSRNRDNLSTEIQKVSCTPIVEFNDYQVSVLIRIKNFIVGISQNIVEASVWVASFSRRKAKKNFWLKSKSKKGGGFDQEYMFSGEHSASRSIN